MNLKILISKDTSFIRNGITQLNKISNLYCFTYPKNEIFKVDVDFNNQITYSLYKGNGRSEQTYELRVEHDLDAGGNVQDARYEALQIAINEKTEKLKHLKYEYSEFWLILVDDIFSRVDETVKIDLQRFPVIKSDFKKIILISKSNPSNWIDLYSPILACHLQIHPSFPRSQQLLKPSIPEDTLAGGGILEVLGKV
jgi:hypothetical protein